MRVGIARRVGRSYDGDLSTRPYSGRSRSHPHRADLDQSACCLQMKDQAASGPCQVANAPGPESTAEPPSLSFPPRRMEPPRLSRHRRLLCAVGSPAAGPCNRRAPMRCATMGFRAGAVSAATPACRVLRHGTGCASFVRSRSSAIGQVARASAGEERLASLWHAIGSLYRTEFGSSLQSRSDLVKE
jgi:hypothetical protein